ncbi:MAG: efflux RND transporter periplasmic adaptor subunit [Bacteroidetes bacterium]|nr:efflux RND transporter periplasmic adaptor subunit [Bacteroidota bacterium]
MFFRFIISLPLRRLFFKLPMIMKKILILSILVAIAASCGNQPDDKKSRLAELKKEQEKISAEIKKIEKELGTKNAEQVLFVSIDTIRRMEFSHFIELQGRIDGNENIAVSPKTPGVVTRIFVKEGDAVRKGQVLAELDAEVLKQTLKEVEGQLDFATELYRKQKNLWDQNIGSEVQYLTAKNNKESLENRIATLKDQIRMSNITAPIDGTIEDIPIKVGQMANVGFPAFRIVNFSEAKAVAEVGEAYSSKVKVGDQVKVFLPDFNEEINRRVTFASKYINPVNRTFMVEVTLPSREVFRANMIAVIRIKDYSNPAAVAVPQNFIQSGNEGQFVFLAQKEGDKTIGKRQFVKTGSTYNGLTEITAGLKENDLIVTAGYQDLYDGQSIMVK